MGWNEPPRAKVELLAVADQYDADLRRIMAPEPRQHHGRVLRLLVAVVGRHCAETVVLVDLDPLAVFFDGASSCFIGETIAAVMVDLPDSATRGAARSLNQPSALSSHCRGPRARAGTNRHTRRGT
jgi:hypothetical protein